MSRLSGQAVYDTDINITWLDNTNLAKTNTFGLPRATPPFGTVGVTSIGPQGEMNWCTAEAWIDAMNIKLFGE